MQCSELMTSDVLSLGTTELAGDALRRMRALEVQVAAVCDGEARLVGAVGTRELERAAPGDRVAAAMRPAPSCQATDDVRLAEQLFAQTHGSEVFCTDDRGRLVGAIYRRALDGQARRPRPSRRELAPVPGPGPITTVLVVDDEPATCEAVAEVLEDEGYRVLKARSGLQALELLRAGNGRTRPDVILLDLMMPEMDGRAFVVEKRRDPSLVGIPVLLFSAVGSEATAAELELAGFLRKPAHLDELLAAVGRFGPRAAG